MTAFKRSDDSSVEASDAWLRNHFVAKASRRVHHILGLPIRSGDHVLDLCCGTGLYTELFALMVGPTGRILGLDRNREHISLARARAKQHIMSQQLSYECWDVTRAAWPTVIDGKQFDVIVIFNGLCYLTDPLAALRRCLPLLRHNGRIIAKDSDFGHILLEPADSMLLARVVEAAGKDPSLEFDNFLGRKIPFLVANVPTSRVFTEIWSYPMTSPLSREERKYIVGNLSTLLGQAVARLQRSDIDAWREMIAVENPDAAINSKDFIFLMHEFVSVGVVA